MLDQVGAVGEPAVADIGTKLGKHWSSGRRESPKADFAQARRVDDVPTSGSGWERAPTVVCRPLFTDD